MAFPAHPHVLSPNTLMSDLTNVRDSIPSDPLSMRFAPADELLQLHRTLNNEIVAHNSTRELLSYEQQRRVNAESTLCYQQAKFGEIEAAYATCHMDLQRLLQENHNLHVVNQQLQIQAERQQSVCSTVTARTDALTCSRLRALNLIQWRPCSNKSKSFGVDC